MIDTIIEGKDVIDFSPWGKIDLATRCTKGIWFVSTPSHGGFWLSEDRQIEYGGGEWHEEDCEAPKVAKFFGLIPDIKFVGPVR